MVLLKLLSGLILTSLLSGCTCYICRLPGNVDDLKSDIKLLKAYLRATPAPTVCGEPGISQNNVCNYHMVVKKLPDSNLYQGQISDQAVQDGFNKCTDLKKELADDKDWDWLAKDYKCYSKDDYNFRVYTFEIEGEGPDGEKPETWHNIARTGKLRKGEVRPLFSSGPRGQRMGTDAKTNQ